MIEKNPFRIFFPIGIAFSIIGTMVWILFVFQMLPFYPGPNHPEVMIGGFLYSFSFGFLLTAIPRFTGSTPATDAEIYSIAIPCIGALIAALFWKFFFFHIFLFLAEIFLVIFLIKRFLTRIHKLPSPFIFVGFGMFSGLLSTAFYVTNDLISIPGPLFIIARILFLKGTMFFLLLGIGSRLIPALLGWIEMPTAVLQTRTKSPYLFPIGALILLSGFIVEGFFSSDYGKMIQAIPLAFFPFFAWKIYKKPKNPGFLSWLIIIASWLLVFGFISSILIPLHAIHLIHLSYVSGLGLLTLMIATRVSVSHSGLNSMIEQKSKLLLSVGVLVILAATTRASSGISEKIYLHHLAYASSCWIVGVLLWSYLLFPKIFFRPLSKEKL